MQEFSSKLPQGVREAARAAADVAAQYSARAPKETGDPDWPGVAGDLPETSRFGASPTNPDSATAATATSTKTNST